MRLLDLGCGPKKTAGAIGIDHHPYPGVDVVADLDQIPWPIADSSFDRIHASHVIEHVRSVPDFMREIHRVGRRGAEVRIVTPHFSSSASWQDPTHRWHLGTEWHKTFCEDYLADQMPSFEFVSVEVSFSKSLRNLMTRAMVRLFGYRRWERSAFRSPARNQQTLLRVVKSESTSTA